MSTHAVFEVPEELIAVTNQIGSTVRYQYSTDQSIYSFNVKLYQAFHITLCVLYNQGIASIKALGHRAWPEGLNGKSGHCGLALSTREHHIKAEN